jgi:small subunit ribosomal protein S6
LSTYETIFITVPTLTDEAERATVDALAAVVSDMGGVFHARDRMGRRRLAYPIRKQDDGVYIRFLYDSGGDIPRELERRMKLSDDILRVLTVKLEREWAVDAKEQAVRDAKARAEAAAAAEARAKEEAEAAARAAEEADTSEDGEAVEEAPADEGSDEETKWAGEAEEPAAETTEAAGEAEATTGEAETGEDER